MPRLPRLAGDCLQTANKARGGHGVDIIKCRAFTFPAKALRQIGGAGAKAWFCLREDLVHEISFELTKEISVRKGETCCSPPYSGSATVSPLVSRHLRAHQL